MKAGEILEVEGVPEDVKTAEDGSTRGILRLARERVRFEAPAKVRLWEGVSGRFNAKVAETRGWLYLELQEGLCECQESDCLVCYPTLYTGHYNGDGKEDCKLCGGEAAEHQFGIYCRPTRGLCSCGSAMPPSECPYKADGGVHESLEES